MATHDSHGTSHAPGGSDTADAFLADRQRTWNAVTNATVWAVVLSAVILILMALFLL
ncbi:MAG: aa3-type cytochrome c oxidase subunit IV [Acetobacteraceae bacterium]